ncbi:glycosyltransferase family 2 protein [Gelidibacter sp. F2691]|nr:glycosyltransferase family 2 protein [Gelidibacter sp. F2691]
MIFKFLQYLQPTQYFQLRTTKGTSVFPIIEELPDDIRNQLLLDPIYSSETAKNYDLSWQAIQLGYVGDVSTYSKFEQTSLFDNYHFIRKYFHPAWVLYVLMVRVLTFHNLFAEFKAWLKTRATKRISYIHKPIAYNGWDNFDSTRIAENPKISVVIPTLNRYDYLKDVLNDLEQQDYANFEVIIVDQSDAFNSDFYKDFDLELNVIQQPEKALWLARNRAIKASNGPLIALSEDDVRIQPNWLTNHIKALDFFRAQVSAGVFYPEGQSIPIERSFFAMATQFATGNAMLDKSVFEKVGLFDRQFEKQRMGDGEFGVRVYLAGIKSVSNPHASCIDVKAATGGLRDMGSWDAFRPKNLFAPRPIPSVLYYFRKYYGNTAARWALLRTVPLSMMPYQFKRNKFMMVLGVFLSLLLLPLVVSQVAWSWQLASRKLKEGAKIEEI